ncbi:flavodoxin family protein [Pseudoduganella aquatica]|uniref:Flavodoxin n=1 Tax=Pseudoduganella aquatica TaxID=2660641 RepID=A0A7X4HIW1_9BURK|nr:flavodoxin [Pseudoduganella aquatica]MYN11377.1 flavodoxin [Pseudoduganella aquatica]
MKLCLIVYYSRSGVTAKVASALAQACGADLERIEDLRPRSGAAGYLRSAWEALRGRPAQIAPPRHRPGDYHVVVLGTPVWAGHMSAPIRSYIAQQRGQFRQLGLFCTMGGSGGPGVLAAMAALCGKPAAATLCLRQRDVLNGMDQAALAGFARSLGLGTHPAPAGQA